MSRVGSKTEAGQELICTRACSEMAAAEGTRLDFERSLKCWCVRRSNMDFEKPCVMYNCTSSSAVFLASGGGYVKVVIPWSLVWKDDMSFEIDAALFLG